MAITNKNIRSVKTYYHIDLLVPISSIIDFFWQRNGSKLIVFESNSVTYQTCRYMLFKENRLLKKKNQR